MGHLGQTQFSREKNRSLKPVLLSIFLNRKV